MNILTSTCVTLVALTLANTAGAEEEREKKRRGPPQVAFEACSAAIVGDDCSFVGRREQSMDGSCVESRKEALVCRPDNPPPRLRRKHRQDDEDTTVEDAE